MDDSNRQYNTQGAGDGASGDRPAPPPPPPSYPPQSSPSQPTPGMSGAGAGSYAPPPPPPPAPQPYPAQPPGQGPGPRQGQQQGYGGSGYTPPTEAYPVQGQVPPDRYEQPTEAYPQGMYGAGPGPGGPPQGYPPQDAYPPQYGGFPPPGGPPAAIPPKKGLPIWAIAVPLLLVLAIGGALVAWSVLQSQENDRKAAAAAATATTQSQATATAQAEINRKATGTVVAQKTATAATDAANKRATTTAEAANKLATSTAAAIAGKTATAVSGQATAAAETATAIALIPVNPTSTTGVSGAIVGAIETITVDYDVLDDAGKKGMRIHVKFTVDNAKDVPSQATAYFYDQATGVSVKNTDPLYSSVSGDLAVSSTFTPGFDSTIYNDFLLFMPYEQIRLTGEHKLYFVIQAYVLSPYKVIVISEKQLFNFTK